jgi:hypothetical protein
MKGKAVALFVAVVGLLLGAAAAANDGGASLTVTTAALTFGSLNPSSPSSLPVPLTALLSASKNWSLSLLYTSGAGGLRALNRRRGSVAGAAAPAELPLLVVSEEGGSQSLPPGLPVQVAEGGATGGQGRPITLLVQTRPTFDTPAGDYEGTLIFLLNGVAVQPAVSFTAHVAAVARLTSDPRPFLLSRPVDPTHPGTIPFEPRLYQVTSNVPWRLVATLVEPPQVPGSSLKLPPSAFAWLPPSGAPQPLSPNQPITVASGPMTGQAGKSVSLIFTYTLTGLVPAGNYQGSISVELEPASTGTDPAVSKGNNHDHHRF